MGDHGCIILAEKVDSLVSMYIKKYGTLNAKLAYDFITASTLIDRLDRALILIWNVNIPLKLICFN